MVVSESFERMLSSIPSSTASVESEEQMRERLVKEMFSKDAEALAQLLHRRIDARERRAASLEAEAAHRNEQTNDAPAITSPEKVPVMNNQEPSSPVAEIIAASKPSRFYAEEQRPARFVRRLRGARTVRLATLASITHQAVRRPRPSVRRARRRNVPPTCPRPAACRPVEARRRLASEKDVDDPDVEKGGARSQEGPRMIDLETATKTLAELRAEASPPQGARRKLGDERSQIALAAHHR